MSEVQRKSPGRPATIDVEQLVFAAITVIDRNGVGGFTMRGVADVLGVSPMSIYRHVNGKDDLLGRIPDALLSDACESVCRRRQSTAALREVANGLAQVLDAHPGLVTLFTRPEVGPNMLRASNHCVALLMADGVDTMRASRCVRLIVAQVIGETVTMRGERDPLGVELLLGAIVKRRVSRATSVPLAVGTHG
jgi:AcrR family transcriptional regulator